MNLKELRAASGLTIKALSEEVDVEERRIRILERGLDKPNHFEIGRLTQYFDLNTVQAKRLKRKIKKTDLVIGEGYVTGLSRREFTVYPPVARADGNKLRVLDLFCGIGGLSLGFEQTEQFSTVGGLDLLSDRIATFQRNHKHSFGFSFDINSFPLQRFKTT
ncbi:MAG: DNA cytosine methyltransferase [Flavobacteriales bacterium]|nr:DNA cytosine methyltransferase [Flavobacteriales bacterium]